MITLTTSINSATAVTHSGTFHGDDVLASVVLHKYFSDVTILRTFKVPENAPASAIVYDIGGGKFDHHQKGGNGFRANGVPYSSVGLIWKEYGPAIVKDTPNPELVWRMIDQDIIQPVDAQDNGIIPQSQEHVIPVKSFSNCISDFNPSWDSGETADEAFLKACAFAEMVFDNVLSNACSKARAEDIVNSAIENSSSDYIVFDCFVPWQDFLLSSDNPKAQNIKFVIYPSNRGGYNWQCVPLAPKSLETRKSVPASWRGLTGEELQAVTGVPTATFCHNAGFIGSATTLEGAIELVTIAINA